MTCGLPPNASIAARDIPEVRPIPVETGYTSLGSLLADMQGLVPTGLIGEGGWERVQALTTRLPACAADARFGFEFDLFDPNTTADFCLLLMPGSPITAFYEGQTAATAPLLVGPGFRNFLRGQTRDAQSLLNRTGAGIILEYDLAQTLPGQHGPPGVFMATSGSIDGRKARLDGDPARLVAALESVAGWDPGAIDLEEVERVRTAAAGAFVAQAGVMPGRGGPAVRLILQGITTDELEETLKRLKWSGDSSLAAACLSDLSEFIALRAALSLDVSSRGVSPPPGDGDVPTH
ncbi:MAG: hypothetical protein OXE17_05820 [Chloroflexi bacterium]|nr:hypothetical protein [Chloroflexota bacterium]